MQTAIRTADARMALVSSLLAGVALNAHADAITDWNNKAGELIVEAKMGTPPAIRVMAIVQEPGLMGASHCAKRRVSRLRTRPRMPEACNLECVPLSKLSVPRWPHFGRPHL